MKLKQSKTQLKCINQKRKDQNYGFVPRGSMWAIPITKSKDAPSIAMLSCSVVVLQDWRSKHLHPALQQCPDVATRHYDPRARKPTVSRRCPLTPKHQPYFYKFQFPFYVKWSGRHTILFALFLFCSHLWSILMVGNLFPLIMKMIMAKVHVLAWVCKYFTLYVKLVRIWIWIMLVCWFPSEILIYYDHIILWLFDKRFVIIWLVLLIYT